MEKKERAFFSHQHDHANRLPITRSSAVFYFKCSDNFTTTLHFLNYWEIKRGISDIKVMATIRSIDGDRIFSNEIKMPQKGAVEIPLKELFNINGVNSDNIEGSIEVEIFSKENLFVAYPAMVVRYNGKDWHTTTHSSQRYYSTASADHNIDQTQFAEEGNQTIQKDSNLEPFFIIHNGPSEFVDETAYVEVNSFNGRKIKKNIPQIAWKPYETKIFTLKDLFDYRGFLQGELGTYKVAFLCKGVFSRIIAGFENLLNGAWSVDHTNFSFSGKYNDDLFDVEFKNGFKNLVFNIPNFSSKDWDCYADIYPTYPEGKFFIALKKSKNTCTSIEKISLPPILESKSTRISLKESVNSELSFTNDAKLPRRFHVGVHYSYRDSDPAFLIDGPYPHASPPINTRWAPLFSGHDNENYLLIANRTLGKEVPQKISFSSVIYNSFADDPLQFDFSVEAKSSLVLNLNEEVKDLKNYLNNKSGWIYIKSASPSKCVFHYIAVYKDMSVTCDHAF